MGWAAPRPTVGGGNVEKRVSGLRIEAEGWGVGSEENGERQRHRHTSKYNTTPGWGEWDKGRNERQRPWELRQETED